LGVARGMGMFRCSTNICGVSRLVEMMPSNNAFEDRRSKASLRSLSRTAQRERWRHNGRSLCQV
jgi:hypothetical protein